MKAVYTILSALSVFFIGCKQSGPMVQENDFKHYLRPAVHAQQSKKVATENLLFWQNRLSCDTGSYIYMMQTGYAYLQVFENSGEIEMLWKADSLFNRSNQITNGKVDHILFTLVQTAITTHRFGLAWEYIKAIECIDHDAFTYNLLKFDAALEIGLPAEARKCLDRMQQKDGFDYLIRLAKLMDYSGDLPMAIDLMEQALAKANKAHHAAQIEWALSNLSDMYGHNGNIKQAYEGYKKVLRMNENNLHALRGLGWIAFSHDKNAETAARIFKYLNHSTALPDYLLTLGEIARFEGDEDKAKFYFNTFVRKASMPQYGNMYHKYLISQYTNTFNQPALALHLATKEIKNRYTPLTVNLLAWANFKAGNTKEATALLLHPLNRQNHEPEASFQTAQMLRAIGQSEQAIILLGELKDARFELGPNTAKLVDKLYDIYND